MPAKRKKIMIVYLAIIFFIIIDRWLKAWAIVHPAEAWALLGQAIEFKFSANYFIAFSLPLTGLAVTLLVSLIIAVLLCFMISRARRQDDNNALALSLVIAGALSNLFDRFKYGYVIDYWSVQYFTVFNLADALIVIGAAWLIMNLAKQKPQSF